MTGMKNKLAGMRRGSKEFWKFSQQLLTNNKKSSNVPPLKSPSVWCLSCAPKAEELSGCWQSKCKIRDLDEIFYTPVDLPDFSIPSFRQMRSRRAYRHLFLLDVSTSTGPDFLPARIFKYCSRALSVPFVKLARTIICT